MTIEFASYNNAIIKLVIAMPVDWHISTELTTRYINLIGLQKSVWMYRFLDTFPLNARPKKL